MNVFVAIMLIFAAAGFVDKAAGGRWGLSAHFDKGLQTMAVMVIPIVSICSVGTEIIRNHTDAVLCAADSLFFDPSMIVGVVLAPDLGGYFIAREIAANPQILLLNGVVIATLLGQATTFQLPVFMDAIDKKDYPPMFRGFIVGFIMVPAGLIAAQLMIRMPAAEFFRQCALVFAFCLLLALCLWKVPEGTARVFGWFGRLIQLMYYVLFADAVIGLFIPSLAYASLDSVKEAVLITFKSAVIIGGALVMSEIVLKLFRPQIKKIADRVGINEIAAVSLLMTCATSLAILPLFSEMDPKGKQVVTAFSISGSYVIGGSLAFLSSVADPFSVYVFIVSKLVCGIVSAWVICRLYNRGAKEQ